MSRQRLRLTIAAGDVPRAEALLTLSGAELIKLYDGGSAPLFEPEPSTAPLWPTVEVEALFSPAAELEPLRALLATSFPDAMPTVDELPDDAWLAGLRQAVAARPIGTRLWLAPAEDEQLPADRAVVRIHMGLAFGTGEHPTTALCLEWLERHVEPGTTVLDYGCGSGVLALAALALGAQRAFAVDNDEQALQATRANAALNSAADRLQVYSANALPRVAADVLVANILAGPLIALAPVLAPLVVPGGRIVLAGVLEAQAASVAAAYAPYCSEIEHEVRDGWVRLAGRRNSS